MNFAEIIGNLGFPVLMCLLMYSQVDKMNKVYSESFKELTESINNNTMLIQMLYEKIEGDKNE